MLFSMELVLQITVITLLAGLSVAFAKRLNARGRIILNAFAGGSILYLIIQTVGTVSLRTAELLQGSSIGTGFVGNTWLFILVAVLGLFLLPLFLVFVVGERRRSVILAVAFGLFNLGLCLTAAGDTASGLLQVTLPLIIVFAVLFLIEGIGIGSLLLEAKTGLPMLVGLGVIAGLPALLGFNLTMVRSLDLFVPFMNAAAAGFMIFYLPFILSPGKSAGEIKAHFAAMLTGLLFTAGIVLSLGILGR
jgi:hypothetical protein